MVCQIGEPIANVSDFPAPDSKNLLFSYYMKDPRNDIVRQKTTHSDAV